MRNSKQRNEIFKTVINSSDHPNAEVIYSRVKKNMPDISLGTVYRNLCLLVKQGLIRQICPAYGADRYDKTLKEHSHFICCECGNLSDIECDFTEMNIFREISENSGHKVDGIDLIINGVCKNCLNKIKESI